MVLPTIEKGEVFIAFAFKALLDLCISLKFAPIDLLAEGFRVKKNLRLVNFYSKRRPSLNLFGKIKKEFEANFKC